MSRTALRLALLLVLLLAASCGQLPSATPGQERPATPVPTATPAAYPPPPTAPTVPTLPPPTAEPTVTPEPSPNPAPKLIVQPLPEEMRSGERIAFLKDGDLWMVRPDGSALAQVSTSANVSAIFGWSWDNSRLLLGVTGYGTGAQCGYPGSVDLWVLVTDGSSPKQLTQGQTVLFASWAPAEASLAYVTEDGQLYVVNVDKAEVRQLGSRTVGFEWSGWSPDGRMLAFLIPPANWQPGSLADSADIGIWNVQNGVVTDLTKTNQDPSLIWNSYPIWSVDGSRILFESDRQVVGPAQTGKQRWYVMNSDGRNLRHLDTPRFLSALNTTRSPVTDQVVMNIGGEVWLLDFEGHAQRIATTPWPCWAPYSWSPDGTRLALVEPGGNLVSIDLHSLAVETITGTGSSPVWTH